MTAGVGMNIRPALAGLPHHGPPDDPPAADDDHRVALTVQPSQV